MNFIENIEIKNFKSIRHARIEGCKRINVFVGPPNVGKSNILEGLSLFGYANKKKTISLKEIIRYEELSDIFFDGNVDEKAVISFTDDGLLGGVFHFSLKYIDSDKIILTSFVGKSGAFEGDKLLKGDDVEFEKSGEILTISYYKGSFHIYPNFEVKKYYFSNVSFNSNESVKQLAFPNGRNLFEILANHKIAKELAVGLFKKYELKLYFDKSANDFKLVKQFGNDVIFPIPFSQIADTLQRLLFYLAAIVTNNDSVLLFEEPESHMYPPYISKFTSQMMYDKNNNQFFLATHSPYVLNDLLDQVREEVAIYICSYVNGETVIQRMTDEEMLEAAQYGHDFFMNLENFVKS